ncbi:MAG TPA: Hpt domain-containing protein [Gammaproteobacteria bacterium]|jgi:two-component system sensor histidine kinase BarA|nr:Hpt domain-containing protein [Gammaproteobacteria bacterium]
MQMDKLESMPVIDWEEGIRLAGHKKELARDILNLLTRDLTRDLNVIHELYQSKKYQELAKAVHKLHGAVCYAGTPRLKTVLAALETRLKTNIMDGSSSLFDQLDTEVGRLLEQVSEHNKKLTE